MNKYQEALNYLYKNCYVDEFEENGNPEEDTWTTGVPTDELAALQELLDKYDELEKHCKELEEENKRLQF